MISELIMTIYYIAISWQLHSIVALISLIFASNGPNISKSKYINQYSTEPWKWKDNWQFKKIYYIHSKPYFLLLISLSIIMVHFIYYLITVFIIAEFFILFHFMLIFSMSFCICIVLKLLYPVLQIILYGNSTLYINDNPVLVGSNLKCILTIPNINNININYPFCIVLTCLRKRKDKPNYHQRIKCFDKSIQSMSRIDDDKVILPINIYIEGDAPSTINLLMKNKGLFEYDWRLEIKTDYNYFNYNANFLLPVFSNEEYSNNR